MYYCTVVGWQESERCDRCYKCTSCQMVLTEAWSFDTFSPKGSGGNGESRKRGRELSDEGMGAQRRSFADARYNFFRLIFSCLAFFHQRPSQCSLLLCFVLVGTAFDALTLEIVTATIHPVCYLASCLMSESKLIVLAGIVYMLFSSCASGASKSHLVHNR